MARPGQRIKPRVCNVSASTIYDLRLAGHTLTITHCDGQAIQPVAADVLRIGRGERYDLEVRADNPGRWFHHCHLRYHMEAGMANLVEVV